MTTRNWKLDETLMPPALALGIALVVGDLLILSFGQSPGTVFAMLLEGTWGNPYGLGQTLYKATTLIVTGLAVAIPLRAGLFNIGAESQLAAGGFGAALMGLVLPAGVPWPVAALVCTLAAMLCGGMVGALPGALKARFGASEVIVTIMLNFIVLAFLNWIVASHLHVPESLHTPEIRSGMVPRFADFSVMFRGSAVNLTLVGALAVAAMAWWFLFRTRAGYELRAVGLQAEAAETGGVRLARVWFGSLAIGGALAGLGGVNYVLGYKHYYEEGFGSGAGFLGIAVALVGRNHPVGVIFAALLFATLSQGGLAVNAVVPKQMMDVLQAVVILAVAVCVPEVRRVLRSAAKTVTSSTGSAR